MDDIAEIKNKVDIVQLIGEYVKLKKTGQNWKGLCPFHNEKTPSFLVNQDRQFYYCFGCNEGGDIFTFLEKIEGIDFPEALRLLAKRAGINLQKFDRRAVNQRTRLMDLLGLAARYWSQQLFSSQAKPAYEYLRSRNLTDESIKEFKLGYALDSWDNTMNFLHKQGYSETEIFQAGLTVRKDKGSGYYDRFRGRIIFPICDVHSNVVGFTARTLKSEESAKYINTPEGLVYHKGKILYGLDKAKNEIRKKDFVILVEGNMDVIASNKISVQNVVAVSGTALTQDQIDLIKRFTSNIACCFDMDEAGQKAAKRSIDLALANEMNIKIVQLIRGKDPDECIKINPHDWVKSVEQAKSVMQYYFDQVFSSYDINNIDQRKKAAKILLFEISKIKNLIEQDFWLKKLAQKIDVSDKILREILPQNKNVQVVNDMKQPQVLNKKTKELLLSEQVISILLNCPQNIGYAADHLSPEILDPKVQAFYKQIIIWYNNDANLEKKILLERISNYNELDESYLNSLYILVDKEFEGYQESDLQRELVLLVKELNKLHLKKQIDEIKKKIQMLEAQNDFNQVNDLLRILQDLIYKKNKFD